MHVFCPATRKEIRHPLIENQLIQAEIFIKTKISFDIQHASSQSVNVYFPPYTNSFAIHLTPTYRVEAR